jgi:hypothetical protein
MDVLPGPADLLPDAGGAESPVIGRVDPEGRMFAAVTVDAVITSTWAGDAH